MGCIYKITNLINNKIYIGQTVLTEPQRWQQHIYYANNDVKKDCPYLCNAIKKYGKENFSREIIKDNINSISELNKLEIYYIQLYHSTDSKIGYNLSIGGFGHQKYSDDILLEKYNIYNSITKVANELNMDRGQVSKRLRNLGVETYNTTVLQYDLSGTFVNAYSSFADAKRKTNLQLPRIIPTHHFCSDYFWVYEIDDLDIQDIIEKYRQNYHLKKKIQQYDVNGNLINTFASASEASRVTKIDVSSIKAVINCKQVTAGGYIWHKIGGQISFDEQYINYLLSKSCSEIEEVNNFGDVIAIFKSSGELEKMNNWSYNSVKNVCDYKATHTHGRIFRYANANKRKLLLELNQHFC